MKPYLLTIALYVSFLVACTPTTTSTSDAMPPSDTLADNPTQTPTSLPQGKTITITNNADSGSGSLRQALEDAQPYDEIIFDQSVFPPNAPETITIMSALPEIKQGHLTIDASDAGVILDGSGIPRDTWIAGLQIVASDRNTIRGLQVTNFTGTGIAVAGDSQHNIIGGERDVGDGPIGQGNLTSGNDFGIGLWDFASNNIVTGNLVGTDVSVTSGTGNQSSGIWVTEGGRENIIGPDNIVAFNGRCGIEVQGSDSFGNILTQNSIHDNLVVGICVGGGANTKIGPPFILEFNLTSGLITGSTCANCTVEIFSDDGDEGATYEGQAKSDSDGIFVFEKGAGFTNPNITTTTTDVDGNTSGFSQPVGLAKSVVILQEGNSLPKLWLLNKPSNQLVADNRLGAGLYSSNIWNDIPHLDNLLNDFVDMGIKRLDTSMQEVEEPIDWNRLEFEISPEYDRFIDGLNENGIAVNYMFHFWDKEGRANGEVLSTPRFKNEEQVQDFLDYVRFIVSHFKGRVQYYTIWSEPDACGGSDVKCIEPLDYIALARQTIPVIHEEDPQAQVVVGPNVLYFDREYLLTVLKSDVAPMFDVISWHGIYDVTPNNAFYGDYYYEYPTIIEEIKQTASSSGFDGEYWGTELSWCSEEFSGCHPPDQPYEILKTDKIAAKYGARGIVMHLGIDVGIGWGALESTAQPWMYPTIRNLNTVMAGSTATSLSVDFESGATNIVSYSFTLPNGDILFILWTNDEAVEVDSGINITLTFTELSAQSAVGIDVLHSFEQELITEVENGNLIISNLLVKDYPVIIRLTDAASP